MLVLLIFHFLCDRTAFLDPKEARKSKFNQNAGSTVEAVTQTGAQALLKLAGIDFIPCGKRAMSIFQ